MTERERFEAWARDINPHNAPRLKALCDKAVARIAALEADLARVTAERDAAVRIAAEMANRWSVFYPDAEVEGYARSAAKHEPADNARIAQWRECVRRITRGEASDG